MFDLSSGWWTWLSGGGTGNQRGAYGIKGQSSPTNHPGGRYGHSMVIDPSGTVIYVSSGDGFTEFTERQSTYHVRNISSLIESKAI